MDVENLNSWVSQPDVCRCCLSASGTWDVTASYITDSGIKEVYSDMLQECYGISLSHLTEWGPSRLVCGLCVGHLRDACGFRKQVLQAERHFSEYCNNKGDSANQPFIKTEVEQESSPNCFTNDVLDTSDYEKDNKSTLKLETDTETQAKTRPEKEHRRKRQKTNLKVKQKRKKIIMDVDYDSDTPIAELSKKNVPSSVRIKDDSETRVLERCEVKENELNGAGDTVVISNKESQYKLESTKKLSRTTAESYIDNKHLRSNICLVLKNSTILPFKHINNSKYICLYCDRAYLFFKELKQHVHDLHSNITESDIRVCLKTPKDLIKADLSEMKCKLCGENFKNIETLIDHLIDVHKKNYHHTPSLRPSHGILGFNLSLEKLKCHICNKEFRFFKNLSIHMNEHSDNFMCHICGKKFVSDHRLQTHVIMHRRTDIRCKHCGKDFRTMSARSYHVRKVHNESKFKCPECSQVFNQYQHRLRHLVDSHKLKKPDFKCDVCFKEFASSGGLRAHVRYSHLKSTEYPCELCGKVFVYKWILQRHMDVHTGAKNYECKYCSKKFAKPYTLQVHVRIHLNDKRFVCSVCKAAFVQKCSLKNHIRVHHSDAGIDLSKL